MERLQLFLQSNSKRRWNWNFPCDSKVRRSGSRFIEEREWTTGKKDYALDSKSEIIIIAGVNKHSHTGIAIYAVVFWHP